VRLTDFFLDERDTPRGGPLNVELEAALAEVSDRLGSLLIARRKKMLATLSEVLIERAKRVTTSERQ